MMRFALTCALVPCVWAGSARGDGLGLVPGDALAFVHVRAAEVWDSPSMADVRRVIEDAGPAALAAVERRFVPSPSQLEGVTLVLLGQGEFGQNPVQVLLALTFRGEVDRKAFDEALAKETPGDAPAARWLDGRTLLLGEAGVLEGYRRPAEVAGPMAGVLEAAAGRHVAAGVNFAALPEALREEALEGLPPPFRPLLRANLVTAHFHLGEEIRAEVRAIYPSPAGAEDAERAAKIGVALAQQQLDQARQEALKVLRGDPLNYPSPPSELPEALGGLAGLGVLNRLDRMLDDLPLRRDGAELALGGSAGAGDVGLTGPTAAVAVGLLIPAVQKVREAATRSRSQNNLKQIALAMHNYESVNGAFPPAAIVDDQGKPLLSWRVAILPYIEQDALYKQFKLDEPWDSEHNAKLIPLMPQVFRHPSTPPGGDGQTHYRVAVGNPAERVGTQMKTAFDVIQGRRFTDFADGTSNSWLVFEAAEAVTWTRPELLVCEPGKPLPRLAQFYNGGANVAFADGSVRFFAQPLTEDVLRAYLSINGGEAIPFDD